MSGTLKAILLLLGGLLLLAYVVPALLLVWAQDRILFPAPTIPDERLAELAQAAGAVEVRAPTADGVVLYGWHLRQTGERALLYFHGNGESVAYTRDMQQAALAAGWDFVCVSPRGYPGSGGVPKAGSIALDARAAWVLATEALGYAPEQILLHGRSLGGGLAGTLMAEVRPAGLVLESTFRSLIAIGRDTFPLYPARLLLRHRAPTIEAAPQVDYPVLVLHGDQDEVIPVAHGRALAAAFPHATYVEARGFGHTDGLLLRAPEVFAAWQGYLSERARSSASSPAN